MKSPDGGESDATVQEEDDDDTDPDEDLFGFKPQKTGMMSPIENDYAAKKKAEKEARKRAK